LNHIDKHKLKVSYFDLYTSMLNTNGP